MIGDKRASEKALVSGGWCGEERTLLAREVGKQGEEDRERKAARGDCGG